MSDKTSTPTGKVYLVGAGPGEPGWITVRGLDLLRHADAVVYDALANPSLLNEAPASAQRIDAGKRAKQHTLTQDQTNDLLVELARAGKQVVRLKGGDPYLFGRGAEEAAYLASRGVACEVVPGITSGLAAPLAAGIPVTHRAIASTVTLITGHEDPTKSQTAIDYAALAGLIRAGGTACFYMGVGRLGAIIGELRKHALDATMPAAVVQWGGTPKQRHVRGTLDTIESLVKAQGISSPAIIVVGQVAGIDEPGLDFYYKRPLFGKRILITRTRHQASALRTKLEDLGADVLEAPTIELAPPDSATLAAVDEAIMRIKQYDWLILTSSNGVTGLAQRLYALGMDARHLAGVKIAAIGEATEDQIKATLAITADLVPTRFVAESLAGELIAKHGVSGKRCLLLRADISRPALPKLLSEAGATVEDVTIYVTRPPESLPAEVLAALRAGEVEWVTFTSSSTAANLVALLGGERDLLNRVKCASIGPITSQTMRELGLTVTVEADASTIEGLIDAISAAAS